MTKDLTQSYEEGVVPVWISGRKTRIVGKPEQLIRKMKKIALEKHITYSQAMIDAMTDYTEKNRKFLEEKVVLSKK